MPIQQNRYYNDPAIGQAFGNIAQMFAPPSGSDLAGYATAGAKKAEAARLAELFNYAKDPAFDQSQFDRLGQASGQWTPSTGYVGVNTAAATSRSNNSADNARALEQTKLQEAGALSRLYATPITAAEGAAVYLPEQTAGATGLPHVITNYHGIDTAADTSRSNNSADNARALEQTKLQEAGALSRLYAEPVTAAEGATVYLPEQTAGATGLPRVVTGNISAAPGEEITTPDGRVIKGAPKPMTESEVQGGILQSLPVADQQATVLGDIPVEDVIMNGQTVKVRRNDSVGLQPAPPVSSAAPETQNYQSPDGKRGTAVFKNSTWIDTSTGQPVPQGSITFNSSLQGGAADTGLGPTTANNTAANNQDAQITQALNTLDIYENIVRDNPASVGLVGLIRGTAQNAVAAANDLAGSFGKTAPQLEEAAADIRAGLGSVAPELFDAAIPEASFLQGTLAYAIARTENPSGEVSRQAYDRALERIRGGILSNSQSIKANLGVYRRVLEAQRTGVGVLRDPNTARTDMGFQPGADVPAPAAAAPPGAVERWERGPDGTLRRAQ